MRFHYLCTTLKRLNYCLYLWRGDVSGRDTGKDRKWLLNNMLRISTKLYFNWTLQQNDPTSVVPLSSVTDEFKSAKSQSRGFRIRQERSPNTKNVPSKLWRRLWNLKKEVQIIRVQHKTLVFPNNVETTLRQDMVRLTKPAKRYLP